MKFVGWWKEEFNGGCWKLAVRESAVRGYFLLVSYKNVKVPRWTDDSSSTQVR